jgi:hypothetical protein
MIGIKVLIEGRKLEHKKGPTHQVTKVWEGRAHAGRGFLKPGGLKAVELNVGFDSIFLLHYFKIQNCAYIVPVYSFFPLFKILFSHNHLA